MPESHCARFSGARRPSRCLQASNDVSWARSSAASLLPVIVAQRRTSLVRSCEEMKLSVVASTYCVISVLSLSSLQRIAITEYVSR